MGSYSFPLRSREKGDPKVQRLINAESRGSPDLGSEEGNSEPVGDWEVTVELAETVTVTPLSVRIARCRVVRRDDSTIVKVPRNQEIMVDPEGQPVVYLARIVATLDVDKSSSNVGGSPPFMVNNRKSPLVESVLSPRVEVKISRDDRNPVALRGDGISGTGTGECLSESPEGSLPVATTDHRDDLEVEHSSLPVETGIGTQVDTINPHVLNKNEGQVENNKKLNKVNKVCKGRQPQKTIQVLGCVPVQIVNLSLEGVRLEKHRYIGETSPIHRNTTQSCYDCNVSSVTKTCEETTKEFKKYLQEKIVHLEKGDQLILKPVLR
jgi:hypothetical protein